MPEERRSTRSPFPGMDPYLEAHWADVHTKLVTYCSDALNGRLPDDLIARAEERVAIEGDEGARAVSPDVSVLDASEMRVSTAVAIDVDLAPYRLVALMEPITERYIEIIAPDGERLITVIEFVSPSNKRGKGREAFITKREQMLAGGVSFVEIDLTRDEGSDPLLAPHLCPKEAIAPYRAVMYVPYDPTAIHLHPMPLRQPLPKLRIPLRKGEAPVELPLQPLLDQAYQNGRYARTIDYSKEPDPPFEGDDAGWVDDLLRRSSKR